MYFVSRCMMPVLLCIGAFAQGVLTNEGVVKLVEAGVPEDTIIALINTQPAKFSLGTENVIALKSKNVSSKVLTAMISKDAGAAKAAGGPSGSLPDESGVFYFVDGRYIPLVPEILTPRTAMKRARFSFGIVNGKINGWIRGQQTKNRRSLPTKNAELVLRTPPEKDPAEYVCLKLDVKKEFREVEVARGRYNISHSTHRAQVAVEPEKIEKQLYKLKFAVLEPGEYGILAPGGSLDWSAGGERKIYTFFVE